MRVWLVLGERELGACRRAGAVMLAAGGVLSAVPGRRPVLCPFRLLTGVPCPLCGMTTSVVASLRLQPSRALRAHPFGLPLVIAAAALLVSRPARLRVPGPVIVVPALAATWAMALSRRARSQSAEGG